MPINFPATPTLGDTFVVGDRIYTWNGTRWTFDFRNILAGTSAERPTVTKPFTYYNTTTKLYEVYYPEYSRWEIVRTYGIPVENPTSEYGEQIFTTPGTHSWVCPVGVTYVSVVCVGGGGGGIQAINSAYNKPGAGGGGLGWENNIPVVPGESYTVVVGAGGQYALNDSGANGGNSYFISTSTVAGFGGTGANLYTTVGSPGGEYYPLYQGGSGGAGGDSSILDYPSGGGGAGGYTGNGGKGGNTISAGSAGAGGGGGGGGGGDVTFRAGGGGGVGLLGLGASGSSGSGSATGNAGNGGGGSGGASGSFGSGGLYGGGGGCADELVTTPSGGGGAVRIIWGPGRAFPSTNVGTI